MTGEPVIAFGQQPCGFFPRRFLVAKIRTARRLQAEMGGRIVFFCHDSDHDPRETRTILRHRTTGATAKLNFAVASKLQRKFSPLYAKRIAPDWQGRTLLQLPNYVEGRVIDVFRKTSAETVADFCLAMYRRLGWLDGIEVVLSSDPALRRRACPVREFFVDVPYEGEIVRARVRDGALELHEGGRRLPDPARDRLRQGADQPHAGYPAPLDAVGHTMHPLRGRRGRARLSSGRRKRRTSPSWAGTRSTDRMRPAPSFPPDRPQARDGRHARRG